ncbi:hypothetical protein [Streptomyces sp. NPDC059371]|uniref:hypothetical protein n=1 Tax=Streptomyces sp. NPDC059371 TaxID=3346812 RepID=UPI00368DDCBD
MRNLVRAIAVSAAALVALTACSSGSDHTKSASAAPTPTWSSDPTGYLYNVDHHRHSRADVQALVDKLRARCSDDALGLEFTATNTATELVDATHEHQDVYPVVAQLVKDLPADDGKTKCAPRLPAAGKAIKAQRT